MEEPFKFRHVHAITGTFVLIILGVLISGFFLAGRSQRWFIGNVTLRIVLPEAGASGIRNGSEVYFLGTLVGTVSDVSVDPSGRMEALAHIRRDFFQFMRVDSSAVVKRKFGVVGDAFFEITRGQGLPLPEKNTRIVCNAELPSALEVAIEEIRHEAVPAFKKLSVGLNTWNVFGSNLITSGERLDQIFLRADKLTEDMQQGKGTVGNLLMDSSTADELHLLLITANQRMEKLAATLQHLESASSNLHLASTNLPIISEAVAKETRELSGLVLQTQSSMREVERLAEAAQRHWLLRKYVNKLNPPPLRPDSLEMEEARKKPLKNFRSPRDAATFERSGTDDP